MAGLLQRSLALLSAPRNSVSFALRSRLAWRRGPVRLSGEAKDGLFDWLGGEARERAQRRERELRQRYDLAALREHSTRVAYLDNLALLDGLERTFADVALPATDGPLAAVDVGSASFVVATALQRFLGRHGPDGADGPGGPRRVLLRGIEIDGHVVLRDGHARVDHAQAHAALAGEGVCYQVADFLRLTLPPQDVVTMCFPFVFRHALLRWGLPLALFRPRALLQRAARVLRPGGLLFVANQTGREHDRLRELLAGEPVRELRRVSLATDLVPWADRTVDRVGSLWIRLT